jgi:hypothetical protein
LRLSLIDRARSCFARRRPFHDTVRRLPQVVQPPELLPWRTVSARASARASCSRASPAPNQDAGARGRLQPRHRTDVRQIMDSSIGTRPRHAHSSGRLRARI